MRRGGPPSPANVIVLTNKRRNGGVFWTEDWAVSWFFNFRKFQIKLIESFADFQVHSWVTTFSQQDLKQVHRGCFSWIHSLIIFRKSRWLQPSWGHDWRVSKGFYKLISLLDSWHYIMVVNWPYSFSSYVPMFHNRYTELWHSNRKFGI